MTVIEQFIEHYKKEYDFYETVSRLVAQQLENKLQASGIRAIVTYRAKNPDRLLVKLLQRDESRNEPYKTLKDIYDDIYDFSGVRVALYFPDDRDIVDNIIKDNFTIISKIKNFPSESKTPSYNRRFSGYWATHYRINLKDSSLQESQKRYTEAKIEIQVASVLMHAWSEVEHDLVYKPLSGNLSNDELAILDELNGLVLAGEIALERLQAAGNIRIGKDKASFNNQYEVASFLYNKYSDKLNNISDTQLGNVELLFKLLKECNLANHTALLPYLKSLFFTKEKRSLSEQIADNIIMGNKERYDIYSKLKEINSQGDLSLQNAIGFFMSQWINLESKINELTIETHPKSRTIFSPNNLKHIFPPKELNHFLSLRRIRNLIVHGIEIPQVNELMNLGYEVKEIYNTLF